MDRKTLVQNIHAKQSFLCVGLDPDPTKLPTHLQNDPNGILKFCKTIVDYTKDYCVAYKPNLAFFESLGPKGWQILEEIIDYIPTDIFTIADAKRGDIGNTSRMYAKTFFEYFNFDAITIAPYMGEDSVKPFLEFDNKWVILLGLTSNKGSADFQMQQCDERYLYEQVILKAQEWGNPNNLMYVIGATHPEMFSHIRSLAKDYFFLVPGVGAQGGDLNAVASYGKTDDVGLLVNSSRGIIYSGNGEDFGEKAAHSAKILADQMASFL